MHICMHAKNNENKSVVACLNRLIGLPKANRCYFVCDSDLSLPPSCSLPLSSSIRLLLIRQPQAHLSAWPYCM